MEQFFIYLAQVLKRAFSRSHTTTDVLQVALASALPAFSLLFGLRLPDTAGESVLGYIGLFVLLLIIIRVFAAPFQIWKEQRGEVDRLQTDLGRPERLIVERLADYRAKARIELAVMLQDFQLLSYSPYLNQKRHDKITDVLTKVRRLEARAGLHLHFRDLSESFYRLIISEVLDVGMQPGSERRSSDALAMLQSYLFGDVTLAQVRSVFPAEYDIDIVAEVDKALQMEKA